MALVIQTTDYTMPETQALSARGVQTDEFGEVKGGHKALFDFALPTMPDSLAVNDEVENVVLGGSAAVCRGVFGAGLTAAKGIVLENNAELATAEWLDLPADAFDFNNLGTDPSFVLSFWITLGTRPSTGFFNSVMGFANQTGSEHQWSVYQQDTDSDNLRVAISTSVTDTQNIIVADYTTHSGTPILITMYVENTGPGVFSFSAYRDDVRPGIVTDRGYQFNSPVGNGATPRIGALPGFGAQAACTVHRQQLFKVPSASFNIDDWIAGEIAGNTGRFDVV